jgi:hypothetical protein
VQVGCVKLKLSIFKVGIKGLNSIPKESFIPQESVTITQYDPAVKFEIEVPTIPAIYYSYWIIPFTKPSN